MRESNHSAKQVARRKLRIAMHGSRGIPHTYGGYEAFLTELAPRLAKRGHDVIVYCRRSLFKQRPSVYRGVHLVYLPSIETKVLGTPTHTFISMLDMALRKVDVALVVNVVNAFHCIIPRIRGQRVAINVDGLDWKRDKWGGFGKKYFFWNAKWVGRICPNGVVTDAGEMRRVYLEEFGTPNVCITYGAHIQTSSAPDTVRQYGLEPFRYYLIASRLVPENNADLIVDAFERVRTSKLLVIAGNANYRSAFVDRLKRTQDPRVRFLGHVANAEHVKELHCNAYAYVHGHSLGGTNPALLKALGYGNCVLALHTPFNAEVIQRYGVLFERDPLDLAMKLQNIDDNPQAAAEFRARAPDRIREAYTWDLITDQYEELFLQLSSGQNPTQIHSSVKNTPVKASTSDMVRSR